MTPDIKINENFPLVALKSLARKLNISEEAIKECGVNIECLKRKIHAKYMELYEEEREKFLKKLEDEEKIVFEKIKDSIATEKEKKLKEDNERLSDTKIEYEEDDNLNFMEMR